MGTIRTKKPSVFTNPLLFRETLKILNTYQFKLAAKRFILFTLFDQVILDQGEHSLDLFDEDMDAPVIPYKQIREWRFNYKQSLIERKQSIQHSQHQKKLPPVSSSASSIQRTNPIQPSYVKKQRSSHKIPNNAKKKSMPPPVPAAIKHKYGSYTTSELQKQNHEEKAF